MAVEVIDEKRQVEAITMVDAVTLFHFHNEGRITALVLTDEAVEAAYKAFKAAQQFRNLTKNYLAEKAA